MFGQSFGAMKFAAPPHVFWAHSKGVRGNAQQRRKARRAGETVVTSFDR